MTTTRDATQPANGGYHTTGRILHSARGYDWLAWVMTFGREPACRERDAVLGLLGDAGFRVGANGALGIRDVWFAVATPS